MGISDIGISESDVPTRLKIVNILPTALVIAVISALVLAGAPAHAPDYGKFLDRAEDIGWPVLAASVVATLLLSLLLQPLELASVRVLEGYWSESGPIGRLNSLGLWVQNRRRDRLDWRVRQLPKSHPANAAASQRMQTFPIALPVLPTALGNILRGMEERAGQPYALDVVHWWPRLYLTLSEDVVKKVDNYRNQLDTACRLCIACGLAAIVTAVLLIQSGIWLGVPASFALLAVLAYRAALHAAMSYGVAVCATVDIFRLKLLQAAKIELPGNSREEVRLNKALNAYWGRTESDENLEPVNYSVTDSDLGLLNLGEERST